MKLIVTLTAACALTGLASAGLGDFEESESKNFGGELSPFGPEILSFKQFDDMGGLKELKAVLLEFSATVSAKVTAENDNVDPAPEFGVSLTGFVTADMPAPAPGDLSISGVVGVVAASGGVAGTDGVTGSGPDFFDFGQLSDDTGGSDTLLAGVDDLSAFIGLGSVDAEVAGQGGFAVTGSSNSTLEIIDFEVSGKITLTYFYNVIPTPGSAALATLGVLAFARRRRA